MGVELCAVGAADRYRYSNPATPFEAYSPKPLRACHPALDLAPLRQLNHLSVQRVSQGSVDRSKDLASAQTCIRLAAWLRNAQSPSSRAT